PFVYWPPDVGDFVLVAGNWDSGWLGNLYEGCTATYVPDLPLYSLNRIAGWFSDSSRSDHWNYWQAGVPAVWLTDTGEYRNPGYHTSDDRPEVIDPVFLRRCTQAVLATMLEWAEVATAVEREGQR
ncbi:MAG: M28 family peptidase, partial [Planctomycetes bacterium]|nr:M28 family peptidase [Planctomycetota bacterium]